MGIEAYIGKTLREFVKDTPNFAINFFMVYHKSKNRGRMPVNLKDILDNEEILSEIVKSVSLPYPDYTMYIDLE